MRQKDCRYFISIFHSNKSNVISCFLVRISRTTKLSQEWLVTLEKEPSPRALFPLMTESPVCMLLIPIFILAALCSAASIRKSTRVSVEEQRTAKADNLFYKPNIYRGDQHNYYYDRQQPRHQQYYAYNQQPT